MSKKFSLIPWFKRLLSSVWQNCKSSVAWLDEHGQFLCLFLLLLLFITIAIFFPTLAKDVSFLWDLSLEDSSKAFYQFAIVAGSIGLPLAIWRSWVAARQEKNTRKQIENTKEQIENTRKQIEISTKGQRSDRFTKAVELTSNDNLSIRLGGLAALKSLAEENFKERKRVFTYLCHFLRYPPDLEGWTSNPKEGWAKCNNDQSIILFGKRPDIDEICQMIRERKTESVTLDLKHACLRGAYLLNANMQEADLRNADIRKANVFGANLQDAILQGADLRCADLRCADLQGASLRIELQYAAFSHALFGSSSFDEGQDLSAFKDLKQLENTFYDQNSPEPILDENLKGKLDRKNTHLMPISLEKWLQEYALRTKP